MRPGDPDRLPESCAAAIGRFRLKACRCLQHGLGGTTMMLVNPPMRTHRTILVLRIASQTRARAYCGGQRGVGCRLLFAGVVGGRAALPGATAVRPERVSAMRLSDP